MQAKEHSVHARLVLEFALSWTFLISGVLGVKLIISFIIIIKLVLSFRLH
jgi:hypothetical protein